MVAVRARVAGEDFELDSTSVERRLRGVEPEPVREHFVVVGGHRYPPKQVLGVVTGLDRADFTTHQARAVLRRLGFGVHRRGDASRPGEGSGVGPHGGREAAVLAPHAGRWVAQDGLEVLYAADSPEAVLRWLRRNGLQARVWRVPDTADAAGSALSAP
jgi:hypothetical protein